MSTRKIFCLLPQHTKGQRSDSPTEQASAARTDSVFCSMTLRHGRRSQKWLLERRSSGLMMVTRKGGWRALMRTLLTQWWSQQASFRVTAQLRNWRLFSPSPFLYSLFLSPSVANLSEPHPLIRAHLRIGHCASGWLGSLDRWWRPGRRLTVQAHSWQQCWVVTPCFVRCCNTNNERWKEYLYA